jgi:hypothetical protein
MAEKEMRNFALRNAQGDEIGVFTGKSPRQAALKAANRDYTDIKLRERGTKKVHVFTGERVQVDKPKGAPAWMPDKIWKPNVKKVGIEKLVSRQSSRVAKFMMYYIHNQPRRIGYEEVHCCTF